MKICRGWAGFPPPIRRDQQTWTGNILQQQKCIFLVVKVMLTGCIKPGYIKCPNKRVKVHLCRAVPLFCCDPSSLPGSRTRSPGEQCPDDPGRQFGQKAFGIGQAMETKPPHKREMEAGGKSCSDSGCFTLQKTSVRLCTHTSRK